MKIITDRLILKPVTMTDAEEIFASFTSSVTKYMYPKPAENLSEIRDFINEKMKNFELQEEIVLVGRLKETNEFIGIFAIHGTHIKTPELGIWTKMEAHGHHYGLEGMTAVVEYAKKHIDYEYLFYPVDKRNIPSRKIPEALGGIIKDAYQEIGLGGNELDLLEYHIYKNRKEPNYPIILFQGDSVTDSNRTKHRYFDLGHGYVYMINERLKKVTVLNRGISGNRLCDLIERWEEDTIKIKPVVLSILIGINDIWHHYAFGTPFDIKDFKEDYLKLIRITREKLSNTKILIIEPFCFQIGEYDPRWQRDFDEMRKVIKEIAIQADYYIPMQDVMNQAAQTYRMEEILGDGVHPTMLGYQIMCDEIIKTINKENKENE